MNLSYFIAKRISFKNAGGFSATIHKIAVGSLALGLAVSLLAFMVLGGFQGTVSEKVYGFTGHYQVQRFTMSNSFEEAPFSVDSSFFQTYEQHPFITKVQSFAHKAALIKGEEEVEGVIMKGVGQDFDSLSFKKYLTEGRLIHIPDQGSSNEVMLSKHIANKLLLSVGDKITLYFVQDPPRFRRVEVVGIFETYLENFDEKIVIGELQTIRVLNDWKADQIGGVEIFVENQNNLDEYTPEIEGNMNFDLKLIRSDEKFLEIFDWLKLLDTNVYVFVGLIGFVAIFNMGAILFILIMERTQMIGLLKALGASNMQIRRIFFWNGINILSRGLLIGNAIGFGLGFLQKYFKLVPLDPASYYMDYVPIVWNWPVFLMLNLGITLLTAAVLWIPVMVISRVNPIQSIRFD
ncbi:ABC transporter permease [Algoriphagus halophytocola]|uniref:ABC transporter permease n=1 Tax=Algoriphagus halophytocola TaxID=2991499 RepID=A0ABY6MMM9_9BACT|nr:MULTISPECIES: FtsX-like permease family protein [unclassified Algoriphagus]UZD23647.1 ABC transporter permease [Algoriphagus sp. TR-M5]WBL44940.1 ABC transporter permease [Algoriphagus sp. TR-M9]